MRQTCKGLNELIGNCEKKNKHNSTNSIRPNPNEVPTSDPKEISNILNKYFATVGSKLASKIPQTINTIFDYLGHHLMALPSLILLFRKILI